MVLNFTVLTEYLIYCYSLHRLNGLYRIYKDMNGEDNCILHLFLVPTPSSSTTL